jgi:hypothetical protein
MKIRKNARDDGTADDFDRKLVVRRGKGKFV